MKKRLKAIAEQTASAYGASAEVEWIPGPPVVCNDAEMAAFARKTAEAEGFQTVPEEQSLGGDDFSFYMEKVPGCYIKIGIGRGDNPSADLSGGPGGIDACGTVFESSAAALGRENA